MHRCSPNRDSVDDLGPAFRLHAREGGLHFGKALGRMRLPPERRCRRSAPQILVTPDLFRGPAWFDPTKDSGTPEHVRGDKKGRAPLSPAIGGFCTCHRNAILLSTLAARRRNSGTVICKPMQASEPGVVGFRFDIVMLA